ncbi:MAG: prepilin-type N-terminal cleavage/methylation domain-containing protein, partial [Bacillota bacterium]|nr:prepilin-type N-terminal cleavage/methylation domain-containing protein [Bacillota bacterium]
MRKGFTLVEVIVVTVILAIIAAVAIPSVIGYFTNSQQQERNETARALFLISQNAMTHMYTTGQEDSINSQTMGQGVNIGAIKPSLPESETEGNKDNIRYMALNRAGSSKQEAPLYQLLDDYISDKEVLQQTVLIEYNYKTGKVLSAFYSDETASIGYGETTGYNAYDREEDSLKDGDMGYWGVDSTGKVEEIDLDDAEVRVVDYIEEKGGQGNDINGGNNYGLLTVECTLPEFSAEPDYKCEIQINSQQGLGHTIKIGGAEGSYSWDDILANNGLDGAIGSDENEDGIADGNGMYLEINTSGGDPVLVIVLDSADQSYSIQDKFGNLGCGYLSARLTVSAWDKEKTADSSDADSVHAYFGGEITEDGKTGYEIASIRHLKNINRNGCLSQNYVQTRNVLCRDHNNTILNFEPIGGTTGFSGTYNGIYDGKANMILDLTINDLSSPKVGLFTMITENGHVDGITVTYSDSYLNAFEDQTSAFINSVGNVGVIVGENYGVITNCTTSGKVNQRGSKGGIAGGIVGANLSGGIIKDCASITSVYQDGSGAVYLGGIVGFNILGTVSYCEVGTAAAVDAGTGAVKYVGIPYFGANPTKLGERKYSYPENVANDVTEIKTESYTSAFVGGIAGAGNSGSISYSISAAKVSGGSLTGGIVGSASGTTIGYCYNAGTVDGGEAGGIAGELNTGVTITCCYNTANVTGIGHTGGVLGTASGRSNILKCSYSTGISKSSDSWISLADDQHGVYGGAVLSGLYGNIIIEDCAFLKNTV